MKNEVSSSDMPPVVFGTSGLGNLYVALDETTKCEIVKECFCHSPKPVVFDTAGKYGAGLALESLGKSLKALNVKPENVIISNKLGWLRTELKTDEPTFEPGVWKDLQHDAIQKISYDGIIECFEQGNELLGGYTPQMVSVHDPDEYLANARDANHAAKLYEDILDAYEALYDLKQTGKIQAIGVGAKNWKVIQSIANDVQLDWVMIANSLTIKNHPKELLDFIQELQKKGVTIINSAVFHSGFLIGSDYYDYKLIEPTAPANKALFQWRADFFELCQSFGIKPAAACVQFALKVPGVASVALNTTAQKRVKENIDLASIEIPVEFWTSMKAKGLIRDDYPYL
ncbi:aldo/keto reductase [Chitinophagaceae bacterium LB-8]|uniref:Aldo/keto reductase n=1 Tax=Paraflavisolibacter caeni TaxID=2982496 RepID=A0A9X3BHE9_9BACT|nr:aldo/keto reductase [Paraflavisolibacter caeni]MCU7552249.1 aldo/keto reductase [Paraflavisolibacter caeni]